MFRNIFKFVKNKIPKISDTEMIALRSGNTSIERDILRGNLVYPEKPKIIKKFNNNHIEKLFTKWDDSTIYPNNNDNYWVNYLAKNKFFSFLIDEQYGGIKLSVNELSSVLTKIASRDPALGVAVMVPNSLGPGELLSHYGTTEQKDKFLPKLADGTYIPCFGLTGPNNGSDATGQIDTGVVKKENDKIEIDISLNKRYITLAPVANLMGIAFNLRDPENIIGKEGVTVALVNRDHPGLIQNTHHNPLNVGFPNGTIKGNITISPDDVIGGVEKIGEGWKMLMDCLSAGRAVSLPATANASSKVALFGIYNYIQIRNQFKMPLSQMEAIQEKFNKILFNTWIIQSSIKMTNDILDNGNSPAVISAIMKQQCTERGRKVLNEAMDIHAGASICLGYNNFLEKFYRAAPIGITVEGSNTLTRSLIIFGQGLNKSHPYIFEILDSVLENDKARFKQKFIGMLSNIAILYLKSFNFSRALEQQINDFALLVNFVALKGGKLKSEQMISGDMADIFSNLYLAVSVNYYENTYNVSSKLKDYIELKLINENITIINRVIDNLGYERFILQHLKLKPKSIKYKDEKEIFNLVFSNPKIIEHIKKDIVIDNILKDMDFINSGNIDDKNKIEELKNKVINVGEFNN